MSLRVGIVGLPNVGKSTLFNALLRKRVALSANYPFATIEPNTGIVAVPDPRLQKLAELVQAEDKLAGLPPLVPAVVEFVDIAGLVKGASEGAGLGNKFLSHIREVDAIIHVMRDFEDTGIIREGSTTPLDDRSTIETELALSDIQVLDKLIPNQEKTAKTTRDALEEEKLKILNSIRSELEQGHFLGKYEIGDERLSVWFKTLPLLTTKPVLYVYNVAEEDYANRLRHPELVSGSETLNQVQGDSIVISAKLEEDLVELSEEERTEYLHELGIEETGLERLIRQAYQTLGLISFLTAGAKEVRAWTITKDTTAQNASGAIHTDFIKKFIRAQVIGYDKLIEAGSYQEAKTKGWIRTEGKDYIVQDGDIIEFLIGS